VVTSQGFILVSGLQAKPGKAVPPKIEMKIAIDAMGGDRAPSVVIEGALLAAREYEIELALVGKPDVIEQELSKYDISPNVPYDIVPASEVMEMDEPAIKVLREKKDSSIAVALRLIEKGEAVAVVSAGSTSAALAAARNILKKLKGIKRPAIAAIMPNRVDVTVVLDVGANSNCTPNDLVEFAVMGQIYAEDILGKKHPKVGLLSTGVEKLKGNELTLKTHELLLKTPVNFIGNVEGRDIVDGRVDIVVCDGFVGNILLKTVEGYCELIMDSIREVFTRDIKSKLRAAFVKPLMNRLKKRFDDSEYGGCPLLGINGTLIIAHGGSSANAIKNAVRVAFESVTQNVNAHIEAKLSELMRNSTDN